MSLVVDTKINPGFENLRDDQSYTFFDGLLEGKPYGHFAYAYAGDTAVVHCIFDEFKLSIFKEAISDWKEIKQSLINHGIKRIITMNNVDSGSKWERFLIMFGFGKPETIKISSMEM